MNEAIHDFLGCDMAFWDFYYIRELKIWDLLDILILWVFVYSLLRFFQGTRALRVVYGLIALALVQFIARRIHLEGVNALIGTVFNIIPIAILVLFQEEIRRVLASLGRNPFGGQDVVTESSVLDKIFQAMLQCAKNQVGALVIFENGDELKDYIETGTRLDAIPSFELIMDIFKNKSLLHDGALIVAKSRLASAACVLPLSHNPNLPRNWGTRHRAAIGISEQTDCLALVVSEETGKISFSRAGHMETLPENTLREIYRVYNRLTVMAEDRHDWRSQLSRLTDRYKRRNEKSDAAEREGAP